MGIAVAGRIARAPSSGGPAASAAASSAIVAAIEPIGASVTPSPRSDWPAAVAGRGPAGGSSPLAREEGTDGLMGRLPFGLPNDTPFPRPERVNRFTLDDVVSGWSALDTTPPWVRRIGGLSSYVTDPYER